MRFHLTILATMLPLLAAGLPAGATQAAIGPLVIPAVVSSCPFKTVGACADAVGDFLGLQKPGAERDTDIVDLVEALAKAAKHPNVTPVMCAELQKHPDPRGRVTQSAPQQQIEELAALFCEDRMTTGSIGGGRNDWTAPASLIDQPSDSPPAGKPPEEGGGTPPVQESGCVDDSGESVACGS